MERFVAHGLVKNSCFAKIIFRIVKKRYSPAHFPQAFPEKPGTLR